MRNLAMHILLPTRAGLVRFVASLFKRRRTITPPDEPDVTLLEAIEQMHMWERRTHLLDMEHKEALKQLAQWRWKVDRLRDAAPPEA
jgi:hypothetical protein